VFLPAQLLHFFLQSESLVVDEAHTTRRAAHPTLLLAVGSQLKLVGLTPLHWRIIIWSMDSIKDFRHGKHCVFALHIHLVFVTKYRRCIFDGEALEVWRHIFSKVCTDFEAQLVQMDGESDHVHLLVNYPPKVSVSSLVNSLKGVSSYVLRRQLPRIARCHWKNVLWSPSYFAASCGGAPLDIIQRYIEQQATPL
jgi:putative transposase